MVDQALRAALAPVADAATLDILFGDDDVAVAALPQTVKAALRDRLKALKTIDPACGSGAFPMGLLNRMVGLLKELGEAAELDETEAVYRIKLHLIEQGIYGVDIQPIAIQISKLRFFISLLCDQTPDPQKPNAGLDQLPNLETHLVIANSLIGFQEDGVSLLEGTKRHASEDKQKIVELRERLIEIRRKYVLVHSRQRKTALRQKDEEIRKELQAMLKTLGFRNTEMLAEWNPYDPTVASPFFDPQWMFGIDKFDIVIGNPPYVQVDKGIVSGRQFPWSEGKDKRRQNLYKVFVEHGYNLAKQNGAVCFIVQSSLMCDVSATATRELLLRHTTLLQIVEFPKDTNDPEVKVFKSVLTGTCIALFLKRLPKGASFALSIHNSLATIMAPRFARLAQTAVLQGGGNLEFPLLRAEEGPLFTKMRTGFRPLASIFSAKRKGNIGSDRLFTIVSYSPTPISIVKGEHVHRYHLDLGMMYGKNQSSVRSLASENKGGDAVVCQNITGTTDKYRIHACRARCKEKEIVFLDSVNIIYLRNPKEVSIVVGLLNSRLLDWTFRTTSTNNHVNLYELVALPIPSAEALASADGEKLVALVKRAEAGEDVQAEIDAVVYRLYGLTAEEIALVERSFERGEKRVEAPAQVSEDDEEEDA